MLFFCAADEFDQLTDDTFLSGDGSSFQKRAGTYASNWKF
jgi:hypothetical protein